MTRKREIVYRTIRGDGLFIPNLTTRFQVKRPGIFYYREISFPDSDQTISVRTNRLSILSRYARMRMRSRWFRRWETYRPGKYNTMTDSRFYGSLKQKAFTFPLDKSPNQG